MDQGQSTEDTCSKPPVPAGNSYPNDHNEFQNFHQQLVEYEMYELRRVYKYFWNDLIYIVECLDTHSLLRDLKSRTPLNLESYPKIKEDLGVTRFSTQLVHDIFKEGRDTVLGFWESLHAVQRDHPHPNWIEILSELINTGDTLVQQILLDKNGHNLPPEVKDIQERHRQHLLEKTQSYMEHKPPGSTQEQQQFYISERYIKLIVVSTDHFRQRPQNELVHTGQKHEKYLKKQQNELKHIYVDRLFHWCHESKCVPHRVMVSGVPGIGKTTLMQKFVYDWVHRKLYQRFAFVFFFKSRELNRLEKTSLEEMVLQQYPYLQSQLGNILQDPEKLLFIFDGLDESIHQMDFTSKKVCSNPKQVEDTNTIVGCLLKDFLLKGCSVLMTSRPTKLVAIDTNVFQRVTEIMGFFFRERQMYFEHFFRNKELSEKAFDYVRENDALYTFCYIPSYCWIICTVLSMCFKAQPANHEQLMLILPKTVTQLFGTFVANILSNHNQDKCGARELVKSIGWMAEHGVMNHLLIFDKRDLGSFSIDDSSRLLSSFMMESDQPPNITYSFLHLTIQEFLAALFHYLDNCPEKLKKSLQKAQSFEDCLGEVFVRFLCGLSDVSTRSILKPYLGEFTSQSSRDVITWLQKHRHELDALLTNEQDKRKTLNLFTYFYESKNKALVYETLGPNRKLDFNRFSLTPLDCTVLSFILESCRHTEELDVSSCSIANEGLERLAPNLHTVVDLRMSGNGLTESVCSLLASAIPRNLSLRELTLSGNKIAGPPFHDVITALSSPTCKMEKLELSNTGLTDDFSPRLAFLISNNHFLKEIGLSDNALKGPHFGELMRTLASPECRLEHMSLTIDDFTENSCSQFMSAITGNQSLRQFALCSNNMDESQFGELLTALSSPKCSLSRFITKASHHFQNTSNTVKSCGCWRYRNFNIASQSTKTSFTGVW
ncbi:NACHT, LRR and PYD domains-containing protein 3-like isoform X1 [Pseudophryne corroboree]|uniref:NACHT, LRR and PYD domains-containing protein 3-like isoform X1 n=2 Tax=Pseudophryne corroboree TaxID=495146 RepID=UPI0030817941